ncbi:hypothetical protein R1flu_001474 [Riccia fluitans]|uniref:Uncharacterized protein n=1 Tax=Riccia fluitans TaxID=41844 RepID=A0ABD1Y3D7_9MARC
MIGLPSRKTGQVTNCKFRRRDGGQGGEEDSHSELLVSTMRIPVGSPVHAPLGDSLPHRHCRLGDCVVINLYFSMRGLLGGRCGLCQMAN